MSVMAWLIYDLTRLATAVALVVGVFVAMPSGVLLGLLAYTLAGLVVSFGRTLARADA